VAKILTFITAEGAKVRKIVVYRGSLAFAAGRPPISRKAGGPSFSTYRRPKYGAQNHEATIKRISIIVTSEHGRWNNHKQTLTGFYG
jgi:hypothetical protein